MKTSYIVIAIVAAGGAYYIANRVATARAAASKPTGVAGAAAGAVQVYEGLKTVFAKPIAPSVDLADSPLPVSTRTDGYAAVSDAMGTRQLRALVPTDATLFDSKLAGLR